LDESGQHQAALHSYVAQQLPCRITCHSLPQLAGLGFSNDHHRILYVALNQQACLIEEEQIVMSQQLDM